MKRWMTVGVMSLMLALSITACDSNPEQTTISGTPAATGGETGTASASERPGSGTGDGTGSDATTSSLNATTTAQGTSQNTASTATTNDAVILSIANDPQDALYQQGVMSAPAGSPTVVNYNNPGQTAHNWVLVQPGQEQAVVDAAEAQNGNPEGIEGVIAWSETVTNNSDTIEVPPLEQGGYPYICTLPGHYEAGHKGALNVR